MPNTWISSLQDLVCILRWGFIDHEDDIWVVDDLHRIAILFPGDEDKPKLIWIKFEPKIDLNDNELSVLAKVDFLDHLRASLQLVRRMIHNDMCTTSDDETHSKPGRTIYGFHSELHGYALQDHDQPVNASMAAMIGGKDAVFLEPAFEFPTSGAHGAVDEQFGKWRGPVIITKRDNLIATIFPDPKAQGMIEVGEGEGKRKFKLKVDVMNGGLVEDVNLYDFALIVKQLINPSGLPFLSHLEEGSTMGVKELCATVLRSLSI